MRYLPGGRLSDNPAKTHIPGSPSAAPTSTRPSRPSASGKSASFPASPENPVAAAQSRSAGEAVSRHAASPDLPTDTRGTAPLLSSVSENAIAVASIIRPYRRAHNGLPGNPAASGVAAPPL